MTKPVPPSTRLTAFSCPHCGALTTQFWRSAKVEFRADKNRPPLRFADAEFAKKQLKSTLGDDDWGDMGEFIDQMATGRPFIGDKFQQYSLELNNVDVSECFNCSRLAIWVGDNIVWPRQGEAPPANPDLPDDIAADYAEAGLILDASPRGAAALLRLAVQKLCKFLGEPGENINTDIASLVKKGLDPRVQKMLDIVRITGNNAVHPGQIDLRDNREIAEKLFGFVNVVADITISQPKAIEAVWGSMPDDAVAAVAKRDAPKAS